MKFKSKHISITIFILFAAVPVLLGFGYALLYSFGLTGILSEGFTTEYWEKTLLATEFWKSLGFSLFIAAVVMTISLFFSLWIVISWTKNLYKGLLSYVTYLPLAFPAIVMAFFSFQLLSKSGFISRVIFNLGWIDDLSQFPDWTNDAYGVAIIFSLCLLITPFFIILYSNLYQNERIPELKALAQTLGAKKNQITTRIIVPILLKKSAFTIMLFLIFVMGTYEIPLLLGRQDPSMLSVFIIQKLQKFNLADIPQAYAVSVIYILLIATLIAVVYKTRPAFFNPEKN
ncbi:ABC transporter permease subunit [Nonlabens sp. Asnod3-A02]|uniref:ABC transporter permease subunit n=1 Tax=Nonlabens sp. Asnod3-A02 TaxID=3160579 RepID=UPI00386FCCD7